VFKRILGVMSHSGKGLWQVLLAGHWIGFCLHQDSFRIASRLLKCCCIKVSG